MPQGDDSRESISGISEASLKYTQSPTYLGARRGSHCGSSAGMSGCLPGRRTGAGHGVLKKHSDMNSYQPSGNWNITKAWSL